jgi:hypothetical protein
VEDIVELDQQVPPNNQGQSETNGDQHDSITSHDGRGKAAVAYPNTTLPTINQNSTNRPTINSGTNSSNRPFQ